MFAAFADTLGAIELHEAHRFTHSWEAHALAELRRGEPAGLEALGWHGRIHGGPQRQAHRDCLAAWWAAYHAGRDAIMLAHDHATTHQLATHAHAARVIAGEVRVTRHPRARRRRDADDKRRRSHRDPTQRPASHLRA